MTFLYAIIGILSFMFFSFSIVQFQCGLASEEEKKKYIRDIFSNRKLFTVLGFVGIVISVSSFLFMINYVESADELRLLEVQLHSVEAGKKADEKIDDLKSQISASNDWKDTMKDENGMSLNFHKQKSWEAQTEVRKLRDQLNDMKRGTYNDPGAKARYEKSIIQSETQRMQLEGELETAKKLNEYLQKKLNELLK